MATDDPGTDRAIRPKRATIPRTHADVMACGGGHVLTRSPCSSNSNASTAIRAATHPGRAQLLQPASSTDLLHTCQRESSAVATLGSGGARALLPGPSA